MAGKVDSSTHAAAIARISEVAKHESELLAHLDEIINGAAFRGSHRSQAFLKHVVEQALHGEPADLRERSIGVALFGRPVTYDTADDAIVRVTASDVRKRLLQHYGNMGAESKFRINLPSGSYVPEFCFVPATALRSIGPPVLLEPPADPVIAPPAAPVQLDPLRGRSRRRLSPAGAILVVCAVALVWWAVERWVVKGSSGDNLIVAAFQGTPRSAQVI